jgi:hypothetical protein
MTASGACSVPYTSEEVERRSLGSSQTESGGEDKHVHRIQSLVLMSILDT